MSSDGRADGRRDRPHNDQLMTDLGIELQVAERYERFIQRQWPLLAEVGEPDRSDIIECGTIGGNLCA